MAQPRTYRDLALGAAVAAAYFAAGKIGLSLAFVNASASAVWPPTGIAIASLLIFGHATSAPAPPVTVSPAPGHRRPDNS